MLGNGALGQLALGQLPLRPLDLMVVPGAGAGHRRFNFVPEPAYEVKRAKPFRPVWDKPRDGKIEQPAPKSRPGAPPLPPPELFDRAAARASADRATAHAKSMGALSERMAAIAERATADAANLSALADEIAPPPATTAPGGLPNFRELVPPDVSGLNERMNDTQDMSDAQAVLKAMLLTKSG